MHPRGAPRHGEDGLCLRVVIYTLAIGLPALLLIAVSSGMKVGGWSSPSSGPSGRAQVEDWAQSVLDEVVEGQEDRHHPPSSAATVPLPDTTPDWAGWDAVSEDDIRAAGLRRGRGGGDQTAPAEVLKQIQLEEWARSLVRDSKEDTVKAIQASLPELLEKLQREGSGITSATKKKEEEEAAAVPLKDVSHLIKKPGDVGVETRVNMMKAFQNMMIRQEQGDVGEKGLNLVKGEEMHYPRHEEKPKKKEVKKEYPPGADPVLEEIKESVAAAFHKQGEVETETGDGPEVLTEEEDENDEAEDNVHFEGPGGNNSPRGWTENDLGGQVDKRSRLWSLVRNEGVDKFVNLEMVPRQCRLLASMSQHAVMQLATAQAMKRDVIAASGSGAELTPEQQAVDAKLNMFEPELKECKVHERAGRDGVYLPTIPVSIRLKHVDRVNSLELETDFLPVIPRVDPPVHFNTCAIVANGGIMLNALEGAEIDGHEAVFRINYAPTFGPAPTGHDFAAHVGRRTSMDFVNRPNSNLLLTGGHRWRRFTKAGGKPGKKKEKDTSIPPTLVLCEAPDRDARREQFLPLMQKNPEKSIWMINPEMLYTFRFVWHELRKIVERRHKGVKFNDKPMTGWTTTMMALQLCDSVDLYGFQPYRGKSETERYHYFDNQVASLKVHSFDMAYEMYLLLAERFPLRVRTHQQAVT